MSKSSLIFASLGHVYVHCFTAFFFVIVLAIEVDWQRPYHELIGLWTLGAALVGAGALPAGWLADRFSANALMILYFLGLGASSVAAGLTGGTTGLLIALASLGLFASIYHPVGIPWLIRNSPVHSRGRVLAINGVFGGLGAAVAGLAAGLLIDMSGWRAAFIVPGLISICTGLVFAWTVHNAPSESKTVEHSTESRPLAKEMLRVFCILVFTMFMSGVIAHCVQTVLPKTFSHKAPTLAGEGALGVGVLVAIVYAVAGLMQLLGGVLADKFPHKYVYVSGFAIQVPLFWLIGSTAGLPMVMLVTVMMMASMAALPAENLLLAHYSPDNRQGLVFGMKYVLAFGSAPIAVALVSQVMSVTENFYWVFAPLAAGMLMVVIVACFLPLRRSGQQIQTA